MNDWYDKQACHLTDPKAHDRSNGRIFKISYGAPRPVKVDLAKLPDRELADLQLHANEFYVRHARRILQERAGKGSIDAGSAGRAAADRVRVCRGDAPPPRPVGAARGRGVGRGRDPCAR
jgi:hypothetical protein